MTTSQRFLLALTRLAMGWLFLYAGVTKLMNPDWTAAGYLKGAKTFTGLFQWFASPEMIGYTNLLNEWGLTLIGIALILGVFVRLSSVLGALLMMLYYFPLLTFPTVGPNSYIVDDHVIYALVLLLLGCLGAGRYYGLGNWLGNTAFMSRHPGLRKLS